MVCHHVIPEMAGQIKTKSDWSGVRGIVITKDRKEFKRGIYRKIEVMWDSNIFLQAKWTRSDM